MFREDPYEVVESRLRGQSDVCHGVGVERRRKQPDEGDEEEDDDQHEHEVDRQGLHPRRASRRGGRPSDIRRRSRGHARALDHRRYAMANAKFSASMTTAIADPYPMENDLKAV